jgi:Rod binding domain-containing protein
MTTLSAITAASLSDTAAAQTPSVAPPPRLVRAAHEFEAQMMKELLKPLTHSGSALGGGDEADDDSGDGSGLGSGSAGALGEFASEALGKALSEGGGFGIATGIIRQLTPAANQGQHQAQESTAGNRASTAPVTGNQHVDTVMKLHK